MVAACGLLAEWGAHRLVTSSGHSSSRVPILRLCDLAVWFAPAFLFFVLRSMWDLPIAAFAAGSTVALVYEQYASEAAPGRGYSLYAAVCLELAAVSIVAGQARLSAVLISIAVVILSWAHKSIGGAVRGRGLSEVSRRRRSLAAATAAVILTTAGLTPYLSRNQGGGAAGGLLAMVSSILSELFGGNTSLPAVAHEVIREKTAKRYNPGTASYSVGGEYPGVIIRPPAKDYVTVVPPIQGSRIFGLHEPLNTAQPLTIPFYGVYWVFRASDHELPRNSVECRCDPQETTFRSTDYGMLAMQAHQNLGTTIDLSCCEAIEVAIENRDPYWKSVSLELVLVNTKLPGRPTQSLGREPVTSTLPRGYVGDGLLEVLRFAMPAHAAIEQFDEVGINFDLGLWRRTRSARIAITSLRLIPRRL